MKKVFLISADSSLSGMPKHILTLAKTIDKKKFNPIIICPDGWLSKKAKKEKIKIFNLNFKSFFDIKTINRLKTIIKNEKPDILHYHGIRTGFLVTIATNNLNILKIYSEHLFTSQYHLKNRVYEKIQKLGLLYILKNADLVICPSQAVKKFLFEDLKTKNKNIKVIYNGLEKENFIKPSKPKNIIGFIGNLNQQKGIEYLIDAMRIIIKKHPNECLEIIGDGPEKEKLIAKSVDIKNNIKFLGKVEDINLYLRNWKFLVVPSISESFGQVVLEAAMQKKPVIATNVGGLPEIIIDEKTGIIVPAKNSYALAKAIDNLLTNHKKVSDMGECAQKLFNQKFTASIMTLKIENIYEKSLEK